MEELTSADKTCPKFSLAGETRSAKCVSVYDGDTAQFVFEPFPATQLYRFSCRMIGYNSAELKNYKGKSAEETDEAVKARDALSGKILGKCATLEFGDFDKYGRPLVDVHVDGEHINKWMVDNNFGVKYTGRGEKKWK